MNKNLVHTMLRILLIIGVSAMILFFLFWLPILEWICKFKTWC